MSVRGVPTWLNERDDMSDENTAYYRAAGRSLAAIEAWIKVRAEVGERREDFKLKHGAS